MALYTQVSLLSFTIDGLEAGQSYVIGCAVLLHNLIEITTDSSSKEHHLFSLMLMSSFVAVTAALVKHNWYPASVFVGDTYCYFAGMTFAVVGILGHFSKTLLLFFLPQILNFVYSMPQLFKVVPCPRHRLPRYDAQTNTMHPSTFPYGGGDSLKQVVPWWLLRDKQSGQVVNMTVINLVLQLLGPMSEERLCTVLLGIQIASCAVGFYVRYNLAQVFFDE